MADVKYIRESIYNHKLLDIRDKLIALFIDEYFKIKGVKPTIEEIKIVVKCDRVSVKISLKRLKDLNILVLKDI